MRAFSSSFSSSRSLDGLESEATALLAAIAPGSEEAGVAVGVFVQEFGEFGAQVYSISSQPVVGSTACCWVTPLPAASSQHSSFGALCSCLNYARACRCGSDGRGHQQSEDKACLALVVGKTADDRLIDQPTGRHVDRQNIDGQESFSGPDQQAG